MKINLIVRLVSYGCSFVFSHSLVEVLLLFVKHTDLDESISLSLQGESVGQD